MSNVPPDPHDAQPAGAPPARGFRLGVVSAGVIAGSVVLLGLYVLADRWLLPRRAFDRVRLGMTENEVRDAVGPPNSKLTAHPRTGVRGVYFLYEYGGGKELLVRFRAATEPGKVYNVVAEKECGDWHEGERPHEESMPPE